MTYCFATPIRRATAAAMMLALAACADTPLPTQHTLQPEAVSARNGFTALNISFPDVLCAAHGVPVMWTELTGNLKIASVQQKAGGGVRVVEIISNGRVRLSANGNALQSAMAGTAIYDIDANGNLLTITFPGLNGVFTVPGQGRLAIETGKLVLDGNGNVVLERGPHDVFGSNPDVAKLCAYLAQ